MYADQNDQKLNQFDIEKTNKIPFFVQLVEPINFQKYETQHSTDENCDLDSWESIMPKVTETK